MIILGLSFDFHDAAAALIVDGKVVAAAQEERFTRQKHDPRLPVSAARFCLTEAGISPADIDAVVYYEMPMVKFDRIVWSCQQVFTPGDQYFHETLLSWFQKDKFDVRRRIAEGLEVALDRVHYVRHHDSHLASAYYCSPFEEATIVTLDGVGEYDTATIAVGRGNHIEPLSRIALPHSLGLFYSALTAFLGFEVNEGEYKVMGMAAFGQPVHADKMLAMFQLHEDGTFTLEQDWFSFLNPREKPFTQKLVDWLGPAREPEDAFAVTEGTATEEVLAVSRHYANIAASVQRCAEEVILHVVSRAMARTGIRNLCLAGGVALNSLANGRIERELDCRLYVQPAAGDSGGALGAAAWYWHQVADQPRLQPLTIAYLGAAYDAEAVEAAVAASGFEDITRFESDEALVEEVSRRLAEGQVIGWLQGRAEWGPRALGNRSILADPRRAEMQQIVNEKIKFREPFRPFAPSVPEEDLFEYFDAPPFTHALAPEQFMLAVHQVRQDRKDKVAACVHADGTARVHAVRADRNPLFHSLLKALGRRTGVPVLMNTSFNLRGEPIVDSPADALKTFSFSGMDAVVLNRVLVTNEMLL